jgi:hypothetical protein
MWAFDGNGPGEWESLEQGLDFVCDALDKGNVSLDQYRADFELIWWCGHFQSSFDGGPRLSPAILARLASFGAPLFIDNYFSRGDVERK